MSRFAALLLLASLSSVSQAQDIHFSQISLAPYLANPAHRSPCAEWEAGLMHRRQWASLGSTFVTSTAWASAPIRPLGHQGSARLELLTDKNGPGSLSQSTLGVAGQVEVIRKGRFALSGALRGQVSSFSFKEALHPNQFDPNSGKLDPNLPTGQAAIAGGLKRLDFDAGIVSYYEANSAVWYMGLALRHLLASEVGLLRTGNTGFRAYVVDVGAYLELQAWAVSPSLRLTTNRKSNELLLGATARKDLEGGWFVRPGVFLRNNVQGFDGRIAALASDALVLLVGGGYGRVSGSLAYDMTVSDLQQASGLQGSLELLIQFCFGIPGPSYEIVIPCFRY